LLDKIINKCYNKIKKEKIKMRKAILDGNRKVVGFKPMEEEKSKEIQEHYKNQREFVAKKYKLGVDK
jgi:hypothetical protein